MRRFLLFDGTSLKMGGKKLTGGPPWRCFFCKKFFETILTIKHEKKTVHTCPTCKKKNEQT